MAVFRKLAEEHMKNERASMHVHALGEMQALPAPGIGEGELK